MSEKNIIFPDELDIVIHTSVPLLGKFYYSPDMSIKNKKLITQEQLIFNSLIKLNQNSLKDIPDYEQRVSHFFNRTSYESMIYNYSASQSLKLSDDDLYNSKNNLQYNDNINNNITFVLDTIFEKGQTLYLGEKPYTILFYEMKINKPRITNKISNITGDPNQTIYDTRNKLREQGDKTKTELEKIQDESIDDLDGLVNNIEGNSEGNSSTKYSGGHNHSHIIDTDFNTKFDLNDNIEDFMDYFSTFISIQINNFNAQNDIQIIYFNKGIWHGIDNIFTKKSILSLFYKNKNLNLNKLKKQNISLFLTEISQSLSNIGIKLVINDDTIIKTIVDEQLELHFNHNITKNIIKFVKSYNSNNSKKITTPNKMIGGYYYGFMKNNNPYINYQNIPNLNYQDNSQFNPLLSEEDFKNISLNKFEIEVYVELTNKKILGEKNSDCFARKKKMIYNAKKLFSIQNIVDFTNIANYDLYNPDMDLSKIKPYLDLTYNRKILSEEEKEKEKEEEEKRKKKEKENEEKRKKEEATKKEAEDKKKAEEAKKAVEEEEAKRKKEEEAKKEAAKK